MMGAKAQRAGGPIAARAISPATGDRALLMPEAAPVSLSCTAVITAVESGDTTSAMPRPITTIAGNTAVQKRWMPASTTKASSAKANATRRLPSTSGMRGPIRSARWPTGPDNTAMHADNGRKMNPTSPALSRHPAISSIGR